MNEELLYKELDYLQSLYEEDAEDYYEHHVLYHRLCQQDLGELETMKLFRRVNRRDWGAARKFLEGEIEKNEI